MADGSGSHLTAAQQLELAYDISTRALERYMAGCLSVLRARAQVQRMQDEAADAHKRLQVMELELERRRVQADHASDAHIRLVMGEKSA